MKRSPLQRRTPLRARPAAAAPRDDVPRAVFDLGAARDALTHQVAAADTPRTYAGPVADPQRADRNRSDGAFPSVVRQTILDRDHLRCQRCGRAIDGGSLGYSLQHRVARAMGGTNALDVSKPGNGLVLCGSGTTGCHGWVEAHPKAAAELGYAVEAWADPTTVPYLRYDGAWIALDNRGAAHRTLTPTAGAHGAASRRSH